MSYKNECFIALYKKNDFTIDFQKYTPVPINRSFLIFFLYIERKSLLCYLEIDTQKARVRITDTLRQF